MKQTILLFLLIITMNESGYKIDFGNSSEGKNWIVVNDGVMGGRSESMVQILDHSILFTGHISLRNNGGFASLRNQGEKIDLSKYKEISIRFKTNTDRKFSFRLSGYDQFYQPFFKHEFGSNSNDWVTVILNIHDFKEYNLSGETGNKLNQSHLNKDFRMGIILYDKQEGSFEIEIDYIKFK